MNKPKYHIIYNYGRYYVQERRRFLFWTYWDYVEYHNYGLGYSGYLCANTLSDAKQMLHWEKEYRKKK